MLGSLQGSERAGQFAFQIIRPRDSATMYAIFVHKLKLIGKHCIDHSKHFKTYLPWCLLLLHTGS